MFRGSSLILSTLFNTQAYGSQVVTGTTALAQNSPYRTIVNSSSPSTITLPATPIANDTRVITNVGAGTVTVSGPFRAGTVTLAQDNSRVFAYNAQLGYWTFE